MKFLADVMLARLGRWLRMFGHDTIIARQDQTDRELVDLAREQKRILLTRDTKITAKEAYIIKSKNHVEQLKDVINYFKLEISFPGASRCSTCNGELEKIIDRWRCVECGKQYWEGSHWIRIRKTIEEIKKSK